MVRLAGLLVLAVAPLLLLLAPGDNPIRGAGFDKIDLGGLPELRARNGLLQATLTAAPQTIHIGSITFPGAAFNLAYGGPVLRLHPGDLLRLHLINHMPDGINLHFHGMRVSPSGHGDNMHILVPPDGYFDYDIRIPPSHPSGLFWYHDHAFGAAEPHVMAGLSGALLIEGFAAQFKSLADIPQKLVVLKDWAVPGCTGDELKTALHCRVVSIDGQANWADTLPPGGTELWRISNQGANLTIHLAAPGLTLRIVGRDGLAATEGTDAETLTIMPASRLDVLVTKTTVGTAPLLATGVPTGSGAGFSVRRTLGSVTLASPPPTAPLPAPIFPHQQDLRRSPVDARRLVVFAENVDATKFTINSRRFDPARTDFIAPLGSIEEWTIRNTTDDFHVFHIHQVAFQVTEINHQPQEFGGFADNVEVPARGEIKLLIPFTDPHIVGHFMFHCHVLNHEDRGMMANIEVQRPGLFRICRVPGP